MKGKTIHMMRGSSKTACGISPKNLIVSDEWKHVSCRRCHKVNRRKI